MFLQLLNNKNYLAKITCLFWLIAKIISYKLWIADRIFPIIPAFDFLLIAPKFIHTILFIISLLLLTFIIVQPALKKIFITLFIVEIFSCLLDQNRWQPWQYQYLFTIIILILNYNQPQKMATWLLLILAITYFYSGLQKLHQGFIFIVWQKAFLQNFFGLHTKYLHNKLLTNLGYSLPFLEILFAILLLIKKSRRFVLYLLIIMHLLILIIIGPLGIMFNFIVWPWNILMIGYLHFLLATKQYQKINFYLLFSKKNMAPFIVWCCFPLLNFIGYWDYFLSFSLYSGRLPNMELCTTAEIPTDLQPFFSAQTTPKICNTKQGLNIQTWGLQEILVPPYPEIRVYKKIKEQLIYKYPTLNAQYYYYYQPKKKENFIEMK